MVSLAELRSRNVTPNWQESVAVIQELIQTVKATTGSAELLPDFEHIALIPNGDVVALPGSPEPATPVRHAAVMLKLLVDGIAVPPELDQFITRNVAEPPQFDSVAEFSRNLAFFERPGRRSDVERLVGRAVAAEQTSRADDELKRLKERASEVTQAAEPPEFLQQPVQRSQAVPIAIVAGLGVVVLAASLYLWQRVRTPDDVETAEQTEPATADDQADDTPATPEATTADAAAGSPPPGSTGDAAAPAAATPSGDAAATGTSPAGSADPGAGGAAPAGAAPASTPARRSFFERAGDAVRSAVNSILGRSDEAAPAAAESTAPAANTAAVETRPHSPASRPAPSRRTAARASSGTSAAAPAAAPAPGAPAVTPAEAPAVATSADLLPEPATAVEGEMAPVAIFTAADEGVTPPVIVRPVLPKDPPPNVPPEQIGTIEVLVDERGDVISVRLISPANRFHERMLVSAAKMWKFRPAYKDGQPVRYRTRVRLTI